MYFAHWSKLNRSGGVTDRMAGAHLVRIGRTARVSSRHLIVAQGQHLQSPRVEGFSPLVHEAEYGSMWHAAQVSGGAIGEAPPFDSFGYLGAERGKVWVFFPHGGKDNETSSERATYEGVGVMNRRM